MRTFRTVVAIVAVLGISATLWSQAAPALEKPRTFSLLEVDRAFVPLGDFKFDRAPVGGDQFAETNELYRWTGAKSRGTRVGRNRVLVTFVTGYGTNLDHRAALFVDAQLYLPDGTLLVEGFGDVSPSGPASFKLPVVGGTGVYNNARGYLVARDVGNGDTGRTKLDLHLVP